MLLRETRDAASDTAAVGPHAQDAKVFLTEYWNNPDATGATLRDGWLHTGDRGWLDADGFLYFDGRMKDLIRRSGEMISPAEIELHLMKHEDVRECAVVGIPDDILGEQVIAVVVAIRAVSPTSLAALLQPRIASHLLPGTFVFVDALPKTETEKIKRHELVKIDGTRGNRVRLMQPNRIKKSKIDNRGKRYEPADRSRSDSRSRAWTD
jgi:acyl-coenzyme A synthetase/AMP-(fatty) acid ligase